MKFHATFTKHQVSLPISFAWQFNKRNDWSVVVHVLMWVLVFHKAPAKKPVVQNYQVEEQPIPREPDWIKPTKAYADQRQKARRNRRRKPKKAMREVYDLR